MRHTGRWWSDLRVRLGGLRLVALPLLSLCVLALFMRAFFAERQSADFQLYQTIQVHSKVESMQTRLLDADTVIRGYLVQGQGEWLSQYKKVVESLPDSLNALQKQVSRDRALAQRIRGLEPLLESELDVLAEMRQQSTMPDQVPQTLPEALVAQADKAGESMRATLSEVLEEQDRRMQQAYSGAAKAQRDSDLILFATLAFGFLGGLGGVWLLMSKLIASERERAEKTVQESQAQLHIMLQRAETQARELAWSEQQHRDQTQVMHSIVHSMGDGLVVLASDGQILVCNDAASQILEIFPTRRFPSGSLATTYTCQTLRHPVPPITWR